MMTNERTMTRGTAVLLGVSLLNWTTGNGLFPLLPLYALHRGATLGNAGAMLAAGFVGLAAGSLAATGFARIAGGCKRAYVEAALIQACAYALMGRATATWQLVALLAIAWFGAGLASTQLQVIAGVTATAGRRGRVFGQLALAPPLGALVGASLLGALAARFGYRWAFDAGSLLVLGAGLLMALAMPAEGSISPIKITPGRSGRAAASVGPDELVLLLGATLVSTALFFGRLVTPVMMHTLGFDPQAITATAAIGGLVTVPLVPLISALSDRLGRRSVLAGTYVLIAMASSLLAVASQHWHFSLAAALLSLGFAVAGSVTAALAGDLLPPAALPRALGRLNAATWLAAVIAFGGGGALLGGLAAPSLCPLAALLAVSAGLSLSGLGRRPAPSSAHPESAASARPQG